MLKICGLFVLAMWLVFLALIARKLSEQAFPMLFQALEDCRGIILCFYEMTPNRFLSDDFLRHTLSCLQ